MMQKVISNSKIKYTIMCMLFSLLFIFMALSQPLKVHADEGNITQLPNLSVYFLHKIRP